MPRTSKGLTRVEYAPLAADGGVGTAWVTVALTVMGSTAVTKAASTTTEILSEESPNAVFLTSTGGATSFTHSSYDIDPDVMVNFFGGTTTGVAPNKVWSQPAITPTIERSVRLTSPTGLQVVITRAALTPDYAINFQQETPAQINIVGTMLIPTKAGADAFTMAQVAVG